VADGRLAVGVVVVSARGVFTAITTDGVVIGTFPTLLAASRALPGGSNR
jgi:hypothetical protein